MDGPISLERNDSDGPNRLPLSLSLLLKHLPTFDPVEPPVHSGRITPRAQQWFENCMQASAPSSSRSLLGNGMTSSRVHVGTKGAWSPGAMMVSRRLLWNRIELRRHHRSARPSLSSLQAFILRLARRRISSLSRTPFVQSTTYSATLHAKLVPVK